MKISQTCGPLHAGEMYTKATLRDTQSEQVHIWNPHSCAALPLMLCHTTTGKPARPPGLQPQSSTEETSCVHPLGSTKPDWVKLLLQTQYYFSVCYSAFSSNFYVNSLYHSIYLDEEQ